jgi:superfamily I DNA/RNA helicase
VNPAEITAVTFTNKAAAEMRERLETGLGSKQAISGLTVGTFHAVCMRLLDSRPVLSENEAIFLIQDILSTLRIKKSARDVLRAISDVKNGKPIHETGIDESVYNAYCSQLKKTGHRDLDDLLLDALKLDKGCDARFTYLLVDEFQDTNSVQRELIRLWSRGGKNLFVIGDPDQSVYGFRGACASCFSDLKKIFPDTRIIRLRKNYRSTPEIVSCAYSVISHNPGKTRTIEATRPAGAAVRVLTAGSTLSEGIWIAKEIAGMAGGLGMLEAQNYVSDQRRNHPFSEIAVLSPAAETN